MSFMRDKRSEPGKGEMVDILLLTPKKPGKPTGYSYSSGLIMYPGWGQTSICPDRVEDYAVCGHPIAIKVKDSVEKSELIRSLRDLADALEANVNLHVRPLTKAYAEPGDNWPLPDDD